MEISVTAIELIELVVALVLSGALTGILAGLFGVGGGAVIIPVLYEAYAILGLSEAVRMHVCVGTAMAIIVPTAIRSFMAHHARGSVDMAVVKSWLIPMPIGVAAAGSRELLSRIGHHLVASNYVLGFWSPLCKNNF